MNNGGLYGERAGWYLPGYPDGTWAPVSLPNSDPLPGVAWYRTTFTLNEPAGADASLGLAISDATAKAYRATIFLNGWNLGQYINNVGPQHTFVLPNRILRAGIGDDGRNTLAIAVITNNAGGGPGGGGLGSVSLTNLGTVAGGVMFSPHLPDDPCGQPRGGASLTRRRRRTRRALRPGRRRGGDRRPRPPGQRLERRHLVRVSAPSARLARTQTPTRAQREPDSRGGAGGPTAAAGCPARRG